MVDGPRGRQAGGTPSSAFVPDYYISPSGNDGADGLSSGAAWKTFSHAFSTMTAGKTLGLMDGTYSVAAGTGYISNTGTNSGQPPSGSDLSHQTVVRAINAGSVSVTGALFIGVNARKDSYITIRGITFQATGNELHNTSYVTLKECGFHGNFSVGTNDHENGNTRNLIEDCWIWAASERVIALNYRADENVWRRVIIRGDGCGLAGCTGGGNPNTGVSVYESADVSFQNVMVIDRILIGADTPYANFATAQHTVGSHLLSRNKWLGCISLKAPDAGYYFEADNIGTGTTWTMKNCIAWDVTGSGININSVGTIDLTNLTSDAPVTATDAIRVAPAVTGGTVKNIEIAAAGRYGVNSVVQPSYTNVFNAGTANYNQTTCATGCHTWDAIGESINYIPRIEPGSNLSGAGEDGADIGANVVYRYGVDGTRYGDSGVEDLTAVLLWPWPNETRIRQEMGPDSGISRGFCAEGETLTHYVWNYLGFGSPY